uniref:Up-regulated during skeletal muscle growth protein 5 isoform X1 n=1 Tax=Acartia pacifica TaxID=335913 RepID=A0A0U2KD97_ACAPC|nr:up-regulated during skeletal muscle growth protein 5 isoform X1 [Acartia pacifica]
MSAGHHPELTGIAKHFNAVTKTGRSNVTKLTYGTILLTVVAYKMKKSL